MSGSTKDAIRVTSYRTGTTDGPWATGSSNKGSKGGNQAFNSYCGY